VKVLHVVPAIAERYGGPSRAVVEMGRALIGRGVDTLIATTDADGEGRLPLATGRVIEHQGVPTIVFPRQWSEALKYSGPLARWLEAHVAAFDVVEIHAVFSHACLAAARACRRQAVPYVVRPLGTLDPWSLRQKPLRKRLLWQAGARRMLRGAAAVHYTTAAERRLAESGLSLARGVVIPLGVDEAFAAAAPAGAAFRARHPVLGDDPYVLALSRLDPKKGIELLIDAFQALVARPEFRRWRLVVAGDGEPRYTADLKARAARGGDRVYFPGWLRGPERVVALREAALFALVSRQENFGLAVAEAMASGVAVLVSDQVNLADEIREARAGWVTPLDPARLPATLAEALASAPERAGRGRAGRVLARTRFTWEVASAALEALYADLRRGTGAPRSSVAAVVLTRDEARNLPACLDSLHGWAREVFVVDSGSTDGTAALARQLGATVVAHAFESHALQWEWALRTLPISADWILALDADQRVTPRLRDSILAVLAEDGLPARPRPVGYFVPRRQVFRGTWIRHGGYYPKYLLKLFRRGEAWTDDRDLVDHHFYVKGPVEKLAGDLIEDNQNEADLATWIAKHARYAQLQAREEVERPRLETPGVLHLWHPWHLWYLWRGGSPDERTRWLKTRWRQLPLYVRPFLYFGYRYVLRLGFLDGRQGFVFHFLQGFWYRFLVDIHIAELRRTAGPGRPAEQPPGADAEPVGRRPDGPRAPGSPS